MSSRGDKRWRSGSGAHRASQNPQLLQRGQQPAQNAISNARSFSTLALAPSAGHENDTHRKRHSLRVASSNHAQNGVRELHAAPWNTMRHFHAQDSNSLNENFHPHPAQAGAKAAGSHGLRLLFGKLRRHKILAETNPQNRREGLQHDMSPGLGRH